MAHVEPSIAFESFQGKLKRDDRIVYRTRNIIATLNTP